MIPTSSVIERVQLYCGSGPGQEPRGHIFARFDIYCEIA